MKHGKMIVLFLLCVIAIHNCLAQETDNKKEKDKKEKTEKKTEKKESPKKPEKSGGKDEKGKAAKNTKEAETVKNPADTTTKAQTDSAGKAIPPKDSKANASKEPPKPAVPERPVVKPQDIKDPIDRKMKGPSGQPVYSSPRGGKYYINNVGVKTYLRPDTGAKASTPARSTPVRSSSGSGRKSSSTGNDTSNQEDNENYDDE